MPEGVWRQRPHPPENERKPLPPRKQAATEGLRRFAARISAKIARKRPEKMRGPTVKTRLQSLPERGQSLPARGQTLPERGQTLPERGQTLPERRQPLPDRRQTLPE